MKEKGPDLSKVKKNYRDDLDSLFGTIPILLLLAIIFFGVSFLTTQRETKMSDYLEKAQKWNEENIGT